MQINAYLNFNGQCEEAFEFYAQCFKGKTAGLFKYEGSPMADQVPPEWLHRVMHATLEMNGQVLMGADSPPSHYETPQGFAVSVNLTDTSEAERIFDALSREGNVGMPLQETFWAKRFGMVTDRFGIPWMVNCGDSE